MMGLHWSLLACFVLFVAGFGLGLDKGQEMERNGTEAVIVSAIMEGKPFMFLNGRPVIVQKTVRQDRSVRYRAMMEADAADDERKR